MRNHTVIVAALITSLMPLALKAQGTIADYRRAAAVNDQLTGLTVNVAQQPTWLGSTRFWYRKSVKGGNQFLLVDASTGQKRAPFDHALLAAALTSVARPDSAYTAVRLPFQTFTLVNDDLGVEVNANNSRWRCTLTDYACTRIGEANAPDFQGGGGRGGAAGGAGGFGTAPTPSTACVPPSGPGGRAAGSGRAGGGAATNQVTSCISPDGKTEAFIQNYNVALRPARSSAPNATTDATMLSFDGSEGDGYELMSIRWAPDSKRLVAYKRRPGYRRMVKYVRSSPTDQLQPKDTSIFYRKPGDVVDFVQPVLFEVDSRARMAIENTLFPNAYQISQAVWRKDSRAFTFEYNQRGHQVYRVLEVDAASGKVRAVISEETNTFFAYRPVAGSTDTGKNWRFDVEDGREVLWMSERDGWNHLYLYDGTSGHVKSQVTKGEWVVRAVDSVDVANRQIYFRASGMVADQDPYFIHYYRINFDGTALVKYTEANGNHTIYWSPDRRAYVDMYSRVDLPTVLELRRVDDSRVTPIEQGDMSAQLATGWRAPEIFVSTGRDGKSDIWGIVVRPMRFDPRKKYPVIEQIYAGPQGSFVPKTWGGGQQLQALAELGFVVVQIDGMGTNNRSKAFHDVAWKNLGDAGFPDRIAWHRAFAQKNPWYDTTRVGLYGTSAGGQNALGGLLFHPEFYKVAYSNSGCHDNRMDKIWWNEHWMGWPLGPHYEASSNVVHAGKLTGRLMLVIPEMDMNVDPSSSYQVVNALIRAGKYFDLLVVPNGGHGAGGQYAARKRNDFFVQWLLGVQPPNWNVGITDAPVVTGTGLPGDHQLEPGFFDSPNNPPYVWW